jgi:diguanylate cyclase (GGDEF)-like protein
MTGRHWWQQGKMLGRALRNRVPLVGSQCCALAAAVYLYAQSRGVPPVRREVDLVGPVLLVVALCSVGLLAQYWSSRRAAARSASETEPAARPCHDPLTGLANQAALIETMRNLSATAWGSEAVSVMVIDVVRLKAIDEFFGHDAADAVLVATAKRLRRLIGPLGVVGRLDVDAFACVVPHAPGSDRPTRLAAEMKEVFARPIEFRDDILVVGSAIGTATFPGASFSPETGLAAARAALTEMQALGTRHLAFQTAAAVVPPNRGLEDEVRAGVLRGEFVPYYEPIIDTRSGRIAGFECLARWEHPSGGIVMPDDFIPVAESAGLIGELHFALLRLACKDARQWPEQMKLSFTMSPLQFDDPRLAQRILSTLDMAGVSPERLILEITDGHVIANIDIARAILACLALAGVQIAIDDMGTGHPNLDQLRDLKFNRIKIERNFVETLNDTDDDPVDYAIPAPGDAIGSIGPIGGGGRNYLFTQPVPGPEALKIANAAAEAASAHRPLTAPFPTRGTRPHTRH